MVRVWYEPPPYGPGTDLNRTPYGIGGGGISKGFIQKMSRMNQPLVMTAAVVACCAICYIPVSFQKLPFSFDPEYQAANRAFMRYHNMDPIFGISSKKNREANPDP